MALPTKSELESLEWSFDGSPFVQVTANSSIDTNGLDWSFDGSPWWGVGGDSVVNDFIPQIIWLSVFP